MTADQPTYEDRTRAFWQVASTFPANKEDIYPVHAEAQEFQKHRGKRVLEYGCGGGSDVLSYLRRGNYVYATDVVPANIDVAKQRIANAHLLTSASLLLLTSNSIIPLPDGLVDVASSHGVIHHITDPRPVLAEISRILRPGGQVYVMLYTEFLWDRFRADIDRLVADKGITPTEAFGWCTDGEGCPYARMYTEKEGIDLLESAGFQVTSTFLYANDDFRTFRATKPQVTR